MNKLQFRQLIREEIRKVLKEANSKIETQLQDVYSNIYEYEDAGLEALDAMVDNAKLTKVYDKWINKKSITDMEAKKLLKVFKDALGEIEFESEDEEDY